MEYIGLVIAFCGVSVLAVAAMTLYKGAWFLAAIFGLIGLWLVRDGLRAMVSAGEEGDDDDSDDKR